MRILYLQICFLLLAFTTKAQNINFSWVNGHGGVNIDKSQDFVFDSNGNVLVTGFFSQTVDFDSDTSTNNLISIGGTDVFVAKYTQAGTLLWAKKFGGQQNDEAHEIKVDANNNIYITGIFYQTANFGTTTQPISLVSNGSADIFITKLDSNGSTIWAKGFGGQMSDASNSLAVDAHGNSYVCGTFYSTVDFNPDSNIVSNATSAGGADVYVSKFNTNGVFEWSKQFGANQPDFGLKLDYDLQEGIYFSGTFGGTVDFNSGTNTFNLVSNGFAADVFICKYDTSGNFMWAKNFGGTVTDNIKGLKVDAQGNIYACGGFYGTINMETNGGTFNLVSSSTSSSFNDIYFAKYSALGNLIWAKNITGTNNEIANFIDVDASGNIYLTGKFRGSNIDFNPSLTDSNYLSTFQPNFDDIFIAKYNNNGEYIWAKSIIGNNSKEGLCIKANSNNDFYFTGTINGANNDFDVSSDTAFYSTNGSSDFFLCKYSQCSINSLLTINSGSITCANNVGASYQWLECSNGNYNIIVSATNVSFQPSQTGSYSVIVTTPNGCIDTSSCILVDVCDLLNTNVTANNNTLTASQAGATYQWLNCDNGYTSILGQIFSSYTPSANGNYAVAITLNNCTDTSSCISVTNIGLGEFPNNISFSIWPNPAHDIINLSIDDSYIKSYSIIDIYGQIVLESKSSNIKTKNIQKIDVSNLSDGVYIICLQSNVGLLYQKIVKK